MELTPSQTVGPFFHLGLTNEHSCARLAGEQANGERAIITFRVFDGEGVPVPDAMIEIWQADSKGNYSPARGNADDDNFRGFGRLATAENGNCTFETIRPGRVPGPGNTLQAPHLNVLVFARGLLKQICTRVYFAGDSANVEDPVLALVPENRRETLLAQPDPSRADAWLFEIRLRGDNETVFFDV
jgi:protocatechuate 3,4-dioxygenase alpha subunit